MALDFAGALCDHGRLMNRARTVAIVVITVLILVALYWRRPPAEPEVEPVTKPKTHVSKTAPKKPTLVAPPIVSEPPPRIVKAIVPPPTTAAAPNPEAAHKPPVGAVPFDLINGLVVAYGDILLGKPKGPNFAKSGFIEAPKLTEWPGGVVPFSVHQSLPNPERILRVVAYLNANTPVRFVPYTGQADSLVFFPMEGVCMSYLGQIGGNQPVYLDDRCSEHEIVHEVMHALGFIHEHSRADRDQYVKVLWNNIELEKVSQFDVTPVSLNEPLKGRPFDFNSVMLYPTTAFARDRGLTTLQSLTPDTIAPAPNGMSAEDLERVRLLYSR